MIISCDCKHPQQDALHGRGQRVANVKANGQFKCTVCGKISGNPSTKK